MKTLRERYLYDPQFHALVDMIEAHLHQADFTPSEVRAAAMVASINYEMRCIGRPFLITPELDAALKTLEKHVNEDKE